LEKGVPIVRRSLFPVSTHSWPYLHLFFFVFFKGYLFVVFRDPSSAHKALTAFSSHQTRLDYCKQLRASLCAQSQSPQIAPRPCFYVSWPRTPEDGKVASAAATTVASATSTNYLNEFNGETADVLSECTVS
jgi:hypothetical protein